MTTVHIGKAGRQAGFSLVELLIATTLGLLILVAVVNVFVSSRQSFRTQEDCRKYKRQAAC